jgi:hypothetical protein
MPSLLIMFSYGNWYASASNSDGPGYYFKGATSEDQWVQVQALKDAMSQGQAEVLDQLPAIFDRVQPEGAADVMTELFGTTDELVYATQVIEAAAGETLVDDLAVIAEAWIL